MAPDVKSVITAATKEDLEKAKLREEIAGLQVSRRKTELEVLRHQQQVSDWEEADRNQKAGLDLHRIYRFTDGVEESSVEHAIEVLDFWSRRDAKKPVTIEFNSPGGSVIQGLALYDFIQELRRRGHTVTTIARGMAASMGGVLLQAGDVRIMDENAHLLIHEISSIGYGKLAELEDEVKFAKRLQNERLVPILAQRSKLTPSQIKKNMQRRDWWLDADEALEHGFVDKVERFPPFA